MWEVGWKIQGFLIENLLLKIYVYFLELCVKSTESTEYWSLYSLAFFKNLRSTVYIKKKKKKAFLRSVKNIQLVHDNESPSFPTLVIKFPFTEIIELRFGVYHPSRPFLWVSPLYGLPRWLRGKESACQVGDMGLIPGSGRSLEKEMATYSSILVWEIPWTEEPGGLQSMGTLNSWTRLSNNTTLNI